MTDYESKAEQRLLDFIRYGGILFGAILVAYAVYWWVAAG